MSPERGRYFVQMTSSISRARSAKRASGDARRSRRRSSFSNVPILSAKRCGAAQESENTDGDNFLLRALVEVAGDRHTSRMPRTADATFFRSIQWND
jgi:hypothetical protein